MPTVIRRFADAPAAPWRNGLGRTWTLIDDDLAAELTPGRRWRLSLAHLDAPAAFSTFPARHRTLIPWGGGIHLEVDGKVRVVPDGHVTRFRGASATRLVALDQPCHAVNLMAPGVEPTLVASGAGTRFGDAALALVSERTEIAKRFDAVRLEAGEPLPCAGAVVRVDGG